MNPGLEGYAFAVCEAAAQADELPTLAADLLEVDRALTRSPRLRGALTDTAVPAASRRAIVVDLLHDKIAEGSVRLVAFAASAVPAPEIPAAVGWLANWVRQASEGPPGQQPGLQPGLGHLQARQRVGGYATAVFEVLPTDRLEETEDELFRFTRTVDATPPLRNALADQNLPVEIRQRVATDLLADKVQPTTLGLVRFVLAGGRTRDLVGTLHWLVELTAQTRGWRVARVRAADGMDEAGRERMVGSLSRLTGQPVELQVTIDPSLLAGVQVQVGDLQVEASARARIDELREHISTGSWQHLGPDRDDGLDEEGARA